jgi:multidrug efflux pump subunit AcrA (membrane-fusion protein)
MDDKSALLNQLRIDRESEPPRSAKWPLWLAGAAGVLIVAGVAWFWSRPKGIPVRVAVAQPVSADDAVAPASILDASGYVVARRQATVASKITGKMVELDIEEGDHVREGQVIARLDGTNLRAALNAARAQLDYAKSGLAETEVNLKNAKRDYDRQRSLLGHFVTSPPAIWTANRPTRFCTCCKS